MSTNHARVDALQRRGRRLCLAFPAMQRIFELEERLPNWIRVRDSRRIDERDLADSPCLERRGP